MRWARLYLEGALAVVAAEAGLVVDAVVGGELVDEVHRLVAGGALGCRPLEGGRHCPLPLFWSLPLQQQSLPTEARLLVMPALPVPGCCWWLAGYMGAGNGVAGWLVAGGLQPGIDTSLGRTLDTAIEYSLHPKISAHLVFREVNKF